MRVRILTAQDGHPCGAEVRLDEARALELIASGDAEAIAEAATMAPPEHGMKSRARAR